jgi:hypothetical protein
MGAFNEDTVGATKVGKIIDEMRVHIIALKSDLQSPVHLEANRLI